MAEQLPHARAFDIPGWPCPPRVRDIPANQDSWGWVHVFPLNNEVGVAQDELGYLWVNGNIIPQFKVPDGGDEPVNAGAITFWTETGIGLWIDPSSLRFLQSISRLDMAPDEWLPVRLVAGDLPAFVKRIA